METLNALFEEMYGFLPAVLPLKGGGSDRKYFRLTGESVSVIGVIGEDICENKAFLELDKILESEGIRVPHVLKISKNGKAYLIEDLGELDLLNLLSDDETISNLKMSYAKQALLCLLDIQLMPEVLWKDKVFNSPFSDRLVRWDLNYFKYDFLKPAHIAFDEERLEDDFEKLRVLLTSSENIEGFMYRDFQSRNIMVKEGNLWFIDFQGGRKGPLVYDAVSFIWQAKAPFNFEERKELERYYISRLAERVNIGKEIIRRQFRHMILFRLLQVLGAYGFRGIIEKKSHFLESITLAVANLDYLRSYGMLDEFPELSKITSRLVDKFVYKKECKGSLTDNVRGKVEDCYLKEDNNVLTISIFSFSYKKGYPDDLSGNGGGFIFDCRAIHNPGRYQKYKSLTGMDYPVIEFIENQSEAGVFVENCLKVVLPSVTRYLERGFTSLLVGFGCTGGQHRSVYCAEKFAEKLKQLFKGVKLVIDHREQQIEKIIRT